MFFKKKCPNCGAKNPKDATACTSCGTPFVSEQVEGQLAEAEARIGKRFSTRIESEKLCLAINQVIFAASSDSSRKVLTGVSAKFEGYELTLAATDGFRLAVHRTSLIEPITGTVAAVFPAGDLAELSQYLAGAKEAVDIESNLKVSQVVFRAGGKEVTSQLVKGRYPDYEQLIPRKYATRALFAVSKLSKIMSDLPVTDSKAIQIIRLQLIPQEGRVLVALGDQQRGLGTAEITAEVEGKENRIAFNRLYLTQGLSAIPQEKATLDVVESSSPGVIRPVGREDYLYVLMPIFVQW